MESALVAGNKAELVWVIRGEGKIELWSVLTKVHIDLSQPRSDYLSSQREDLFVGEVEIPTCQEVVEKVGDEGVFFLDVLLDCIRERHISVAVFALVSRCVDQVLVLELSYTPARFVVTRKQICLVLLAPEAPVAYSPRKKEANKVIFDFRSVAVAQVGEKWCADFVEFEEGLLQFCFVLLDFFVPNSSTRQ